MRLLIVSQYFWPEDFRINDLTEALVQRGYEVTVLTGIPNYPEGRVHPGFASDREAYDLFKGARIVRAPMLPRGVGSKRLMLNYASFVLGALFKGLWALRGQSFDVIFVFEPSPVTVAFPALALGRVKRAPVVFWVLDLWPETLAAVGVIRSQRVLSWVGRMVSFIYNRCHLVLGQSKGFLRHIARYCADTSKVRYFPNWVEDLYAQGASSPAPEIPFRPDLFTVVFAGNLGEAQDLPAVLEAIKILASRHDIRWLFVGDGRKASWFREAVMGSGLQDRVVMAGRYPPDRMPSFFAHADALLVSLKRDPVFSLTIPGKVQSYLMSGVPLLGMLDGEGAALIEEAQAGFTCPAGQGGALAQAVLQMAALDADERRQMGANGAAFALREFSRSALMDKLEQLMEEAAQDSHRRRARP